MGCSNARLLVQQSPLEENSHAISSRSRNLAATTAENRVPQSSPFLIDDHLQSRVHLNGVDLVVERNGSYTLLLTPKTHKQLMPYVMRKKRFRYD
ncbi:unnamed protein product [Didymodactylos carnosus]|uniref:Uncharacterized protein n=1 Tax=Didymodactylos carnosus TaxID=1234261 RepID=A0A8S2SK87_9BILA|nr:unnamed protein product [Didymodactylos carnosus]CAF4228274.1 unnamed protein product [Didymodactylos carnosus]